MAPVTRLLFSSFLLPLLAVSFANYDYDQSTQQHPDHNDHDQLLDKIIHTKSDHSDQTYSNVDDDDNINDQVHEGLIPTNKFIAIQGLILCKSGLTYLPLEGAEARIECESTKDEISGIFGYYDKSAISTNRLSIVTDPTDSNGFFLETLSLSHLKVNNKWKLINKCKVFLGASPSQKCKIPTNVNGGISGASLLYNININININILKDKILYTVGPFIYTSLSEFKPLPNHDLVPAAAAGGGYY